MTSKIIPRESGDDVTVKVRLRRSNFEALKNGGLSLLGLYRWELFPDPDDEVCFALRFWASEVPAWPATVPGNEAMRERLDERHAASEAEAT